MDSHGFWNRSKSLFSRPFPWGYFMRYNAVWKEGRIGRGRNIEHPTLNIEVEEKIAQRRWGAEEEAEEGKSWKAECPVSFSELGKSSVAHLAWTERSGVKCWKAEKLKSWKEEEESKVLKSNVGENEEVLRLEEARHSCRALRKDLPQRRGKSYWL